MFEGDSQLTSGTISVTNGFYANRVRSLPLPIYNNLPRINREHTLNISRLRKRLRKLFTKDVYLHLKKHRLRLRRELRLERIMYFKYWFVSEIKTRIESSIDSIIHAVILFLLSALKDRIWFLH